MYVFVILYVTTINGHSNLIPMARTLGKTGIPNFICVYRLFIFIYFSS